MIAAYERSWAVVSRNPVSSCAKACMVSLQIEVRESHMKQMIRLVVAAMFVAVAQQTCASVVIASTRVIYPAGDREVTIRLTNKGNTPVLVQAWLDNGEMAELPTKIAVPFILTPPIFRMEPDKGQALRLRYTGEPLAKDKETMFWLNVLEVPPKDKAAAEANAVRMVIRTRIKVLFRPEALPGKAKTAPAKLTWSIVRHGNGYALKASNATPYFVNLGAVSLNIADRHFDAGQGYVAPYGAEYFPIKAMTSVQGVSAEVEYNSLDDRGESKENKKEIETNDSVIRPIPSK